MKKNPITTTTYSVARYLAVLAFVMISLVSCKNDDDPSPGAGNDVAGDWKISSWTISPPRNGISDVISVLTASTGNDCVTKIILTFKNDGTMKGDLPQECQGTDLVDIIGDYRTSTWKVKGKKIIISEGNGASEHDLDVNNTTMTWSTSEVDPDDGKTYTTTLSFKRN